MRFTCLFCLVAFFAVTFQHLVADEERPAEPITDEQREFFESRIRPVLVQQCYECHNSQTATEGGLNLDHRKSMRAGGDSGPLIAKAASESLLLKVIRHEIDGLEMPEGGERLSDSVLRDFEQWIEMGAPDPRDAPPSADELSASTSWDAVLAKRKAWWSFQPIQRPPLPESNDWSAQSIDRFVHARMSEQKLEPALEADPATLVRRVYFALTGLPPSAEQVDAFASDSRPNAYVRLVDRLLDSQHFGERWARHWMDWVRYAESHGSEGDPRIEGAYRYRDYLIRALNSDIPYDQLLREHIAGDLMSEPRVNRELMINESLVGTAHWRMVFHGFAPTDALDEKVRFTDDAINTFSKAFMGLTISCARCHNHKFDAISQADYYAMFGILGATRPGRSAIDLPERLNQGRDELIDLKAEIRLALSAQWLQSIDGLSQRLLADDSLWKAADKPTALLNDWFVMKQQVKSPSQFSDQWKQRVNEFKDAAHRESQFRKADSLASWRMSAPQDHGRWYRSGNGLSNAPAQSGEFAILPSGDSVVRGIYPAGVYTHALSEKHDGRLASEDVRLDGKYRLWIRTIGGGEAMTRYVAQNYPRNGTVYPVRSIDAGKGWQWQSYDLSYWSGDDIHVELATSRAAPLLTKGSERSWFGLREAVILPMDAPSPQESREFAALIFELAATAEPSSFEELADLYATQIRRSVTAWSVGKVSDAQALLLDRCIAEGLLPNRLDDLETVKPLVERYRRIEQSVPVSQTVATLAEWQGHDQPLFERGDHKKPGELIPRRFIEAIDSEPYKTELSGRLQLADDMLRDDNPFTARVIVNRIWHHLFGQGIVSTTDNFGRLGERPSHPRLLDYLASEFRETDHWSIKAMIRRIVLSRTWRQSSEASAGAIEIDPENRLVSHQSVRRLEAETIRDSLLVASGRLDEAQFGPASNGNSTRRSVYVAVIRNALDPFLTTFDAPVPFSCTGRRSVSNVPAQSLMMMNNAFVIDAARNLAKLAREDADRDAKSKPVTTDDRLSLIARHAWRRALGHSPSQHELAASLTFMHGVQDQATRLANEAESKKVSIAKISNEIAGILDPVRKELLAATQSETERPGIDLRPLASWSFDDLKDAAGKLDLRLKGSARIEQGELILDGNGFAESVPLKDRLREKTLEVLVRIAPLSQRGGGAMSIQTTNGVLFDSIVFAEQQSQHWLAGSNNFARTQSFQGSSEQRVQEEPVHFAITYSDDGMITGFRNGQRYGKPYKTGVQEYAAGSSQVLFGLRHGTGVGANRMLRGRVLEARLYDRALTETEVAHAATGTANIVTHQQVLAKLSAAKREQVGELEIERDRLSEEIEGIRIPSPDQHIVELAHSLLNMKEFIYVK